MALNLNSSLILSGSLEITGSFETSGSSTFNGTFIGDGSSLTGVTGSWDGDFSGSAVMTGSVDMTGSISATSFSGDGSSLTGVTAEFDGSHTGSASFSGSLEIQGRVTQIGLGESTYFGDQAGEDDDITTNKNTGFGFAALKENAAGCRNVGIGHNAFKTNTGGDSNTAVGFSAMSLNNNGNNNVAIGANALSNDNSGDENTVIGALAAVANDTGDRNTAVGFCSLFGTHTGNCNTAIGHCAGRFATGSSAGNVFLGHMAGPSVASGDINNKLYINNTTGSALIEGDFSLDQVTINGSLTASGISIPASKNIVMTDTSKIIMDSDFQIFKNIGNNSVIQEGGSGDLMLLSNNEIEIKSGELGETFAKFTKDAGIELYTDNVKKLETTTNGIIVSGSITGSSITVGSLTSAINPAIHAKTSNTSENILLESTDTGAGSAPDLVLFRNAGAPSDNDTLGVIEYKANQIGGSNPFVYNGIYSRIIDASQQQSALTISAFYGSSTSHAIGIHNLADNTSTGAVIVNPTGFAQVPQHTLQVEGTTSISSSLFVSGSTVIFNNLPTSNPNVAGQLYNDGGTLKISAG